MFSVPLIQTSLGKDGYVKYYPIITFPSSGPIEFFVLGESASFIDILYTRLHLHTKFKKPDGTDLTEDNKIVPVCNFFNLIFI